MTKIEQPTPLQIKSLRESVGLTQKQAAELLDATERTWRRWESDSDSINIPKSKWELFLMKTVTMPKKK
ncbi:MAG: helix-turn-helix domain-containing protein [Pseudomonadota bacterium]